MSAPVRIERSRINSDHRPLDRIGRSVQADSLIIKIALVFKLVVLGIASVFTFGEMHRKIKASIVQIQSRRARGGTVLDVAQQRISPSRTPIEGQAKQASANFRLASAIDKVSPSVGIGVIVGLACERAKRKLFKSEENPGGISFNGSLRTINYFEKKPKEKLFDIVKDYMVALGTYHYEDKNFPHGGQSPASTVDDALQKVGKNTALYQQFIDACMQEMDEPTRRLIIDNLSECLLWNRYIVFPLPEGSSAVIDTIRYMQKHTNHASLQQLFVAVLTNNTQLLAKCLDAGISPFVLIPPRFRGDKPCSAFDIALRQGNLACVKMLLDKARFPLGDVKECWQYVKTVEMFNLLLAYGMKIEDSAKYDAENVLDVLLNNYLEPTETEIGRKHWLELVTHLLPRLPKSVVQINSEGKTWVESLYKTALQNPAAKPFLQEVLKVYPDLVKGAILSDMEQRILDNNEREWLVNLPANRKSHFEKLLASGSGDSNYMLQLTKVHKKLESQLELHNLDPESIDADLIVEAHILKKKVKKHLKSLGDESSAQGDIKALWVTYRQFESIYDKAVDKHPGFSTVRKFSREIRKNGAEYEGTYAGSKTTTRLTKFWELWLDSFPKAGETAKEWRSESIGVRRKVCEGAKQVMSQPPRKRWLTLLHGVNSAALPVIKKLGNKLLPSGELFKRGVAPLTGEAKGAICGVNIKAISCLTPDFAWNQDLSGLGSKKRSTRFVIGEEYSTRAEQAGRPLVFDRDAEFAKFKEYCANIKAGNIPEMMPHGSETPDFEWQKFWFDFNRSIIRLKMTGNKKFMEDSHEDLLALLGLRHQPLGLKACLTNWQASPAVEVDANDALIVNKYPLLFASSKDGIKKDSSTLRQETLIEGELELGKDLDYAFTSPEGLQPLRAALADTGVTVMTFDAGRYLQMRMMDSQLNPFLKEQGEKGSMETFVQQFQAKVLPFYTRPLPQDVSYIQGGERIVKPKSQAFYGHTYRADFESYNKAVKNGETLPRKIHGPMHASRVSLYSLLLAQIMGELGSPAEVSKELLSVTAGMHDSARQDEAVDLWDAESAELTKHVVKDQLGINDEEILRILTHAIAEKDPKGGKFETNVQRIIHDADALDILRLPQLMLEPGKFRTSELAFTKLDAAKDFPVQELVKEVAEFVKITENPALKKHLEFHSESYFQDVMLIFRDLQVSNNSFPIMAKHLMPMISALGPKQLNPEVRQLIGLS